MSISLLRPIALALALGTLGSANAVEYTSLNHEASRITFGYSQMNVAMEGGFGDMKATQFSFDPDNPAAAEVAIELSLGSVDAGYEEANTELEKAEWLDLASHPLATFQSSNVKALGENHYQATGDLAIKGKSREVTVPVTFKEDGGTGVFEGSFTFQRADFGIGEGQWSNFGIIATT
nr:YceI family protein [Pseudomonas sp.]